MRPHLAALRFSLPWGLLALPSRADGRGGRQIQVVSLLLLLVVMAGVALLAAHALLAGGGTAAPY